MEQLTSNKNNSPAKEYVKLSKSGTVEIFQLPLVFAKKWENGFFFVCVVLFFFAFFPIVSSPITRDKLLALTMNLSMLDQICDIREGN